MSAWLVVVVLALGAAPLGPIGPEVVEAVGEPAATPLSGAALEAHLAALSSEIRCPVCQGQAIVDSPAESARNMKDQVRAMLAAGFSDAQILTWLEGRYGEFIRLSPRPDGLNLIVWLLPLGALVLGVVVVIAVVARSRRGAARAEATPQDEAATASAASAGTASAGAQPAASAASAGTASAASAGTARSEGAVDPYLERVRREAGGRDG